MALMPVDDALARILVGAAPRGEPEMLPLAQCFDRVLAQDLAALRTHPPSTPRPWTAMRCARKNADCRRDAESCKGEAAAGHGFNGRA